MSTEGSDAGLEDVDEVWVGGDISVSGEEFVDALEGVGRLAEAMETVSDELTDLNTGLDREDAIRLIYARNHDMTMSQVEQTFDAIDALADGSIDEAGARLLAATNTKLTITDAAEVLNEMGTLAAKYGPEDAQ